MEVWELVARESVRDLVARYNANGDAGRFEQVLELFAADAVMEIDGRRYIGHEQIRTIFTDAAQTAVRWLQGGGEQSTAGAGPSPAARRVQHRTATLQIDVHSETMASSRCYYQVVTSKGLDHWGRYLDTYGVEEGRWRFTCRKELLDGWVPGGFAEMATGRGAPAAPSPATS